MAGGEIAEKVFFAGLRGVSGVTAHRESGDGGARGFGQAEGEDERGAKQERGGREDEFPPAQGPIEHRVVDREQETHHPVAILAMKWSAHEQAAKHRHHRDREERRPHHRERLRERQRMEQLALLPGEREHRNEGEDDDHHREEDRPAHLARSLENDLPRFERREPH